MKKIKTVDRFLEIIPYWDILIGYGVQDNTHTPPCIVQPMKKGERERVRNK